jgi:hypothetical protein
VIFRACPDAIGVAGRDDHDAAYDDAHEAVLGFASRSAGDVAIIDRAGM